ncbi:GIY-YIG nuclease family protein [Aeromonas hydrophila]|uniref:GIY-YIG nuclease family protein n=1 Tax=Aeromonas hydrophila TaxID=644 RepID=UPI002B46AC87|nr:GIY-YIG nuclease family protein [Aeromonas hydrophila]
MSTYQCFEELEFDLPSALLNQLVTLFHEMPEGPLNAEAVQKIDDAQGVYQLFLKGKLVYIGKTDAQAGLRARLLRHSTKIRSRRNLAHDTIGFKAVRVFVFTAMDLEELLIKHYKASPTPPIWNLSGFGSNDPGRNRDHTVLKAGHFDKSYPIDLDLVVELTTKNGQASAAEVLSQLKEQLAYNIRFEGKTSNSKSPHPDLVATNIHFPTNKDTVLNILRIVKIALGSEWQFTALPGYIIGYREKTTYKEGITIEPI